MATFKKPKAFNPDAKPAPVASKKEQMSAELGLSDDGDSAESGSGSEGEEDKRSQSDAGGVSFLEFLALQKSLRRVTEQRVELLDENKELNAKLKKTQDALERLQASSKMQMGILQAAQRTQLEEKDGLNDSLKLVVEEMESGSQKSQGIRQMVETITKLSNEKRTLFEKAELTELNFNQAKQELAELERASEERITDLKREVTELRAKIDPVARAATVDAAAGGASSAEVEALKKQIESLKDKLEIQAAQSAAAASEPGKASIEAEGLMVRLQAELKEKKREVAELREQLNDSLGRAAKLQAVSDTGSAAAQQQSKQVDTLNTELLTLQKQARSTQLQMEELQSQLKSETDGHARVKAELADLRASLDAEVRKMQGQAAAGEDAKKGVEAQLQSATSELASERASLKAEKASHAATQKELAQAKTDLRAAKEEAMAATGSHAEALAAERDRHATAIQNAKAEAAAALAEATQRQAAQMKELKERLGAFSTLLAPIAAAVKSISKDYRVLHKESRELSATIGTAVKQCRRDMIKALADVDRQYKEMLSKYRKEMLLRKKLHNELVDLRGNIRVYCRLRPIIEEDGDECELVVRPDPQDDQYVSVTNKGKVSDYEFDAVFPSTSTQEQVYDRVNDLVISVVDGFNVCIFAYGQTGSGKTFTMEGTTTHPGVNRRALRSLFDICKERSTDWSYELEVSVLEIYNESLRDLLTDKPKGKLEIRHGKAGAFVENLTRCAVRNLEDVNERFAFAKTLRSVASTAMNQESSRSHMILVVYVTGTNLSTGTQTRGKINLIDLAGSERVSKSGAIDDEHRLKEATAINKSLSSLGDVINAIGTKQKHVPYRNSQLTHLLQDSLGGQAKTLMVVQISPVIKNVGESVCSLNFALRVRACELGSAKKQADSAEVASLRKRIAELEAGK